MGLVRVWQDIQQNDQTTSTFDYKALTLEQSCIQMWEAQYAGVTDANTVDATTTAGIPTFATYYAIGSNYGFVVQQAIAKRRSDSPFIFDVQVTLNRKISFQPGGAEKWATSISINGQEYTQDAYVDKDGNPVQNSAGGPFDPTLKRTYNDEVIAVKYKTLTPPDLSSLRGYVNGSTVSFSIQGFSKSYTARQLKLKSGDISTTYVDGTSGNNHVWDVSMQFLARKDKFIDQVVDQGYYQRSVSTTSPNLCGGGGTPGPPAGTVHDIMDADGRQMSAPSRLDGTGQVLTVGGGAAIYLCFPIEPEADFSSLFSGLS